MRFQEFRSRIKSFSKPSTADNSKGTIKRPSIKSASTHNNDNFTFDSSIPSVMISSPKAPLSSMMKKNSKKLAQSNTGEMSETRDYEEFLEKARREAEKDERRRAKEIREARERNMSPWAGRM